MRSPRIALLSGAGRRPSRSARINAGADPVLLAGLRDRLPRGRAGSPPALVELDRRLPGACEPDATDDRRRAAIACQLDAVLQVPGVLEKRLEPRVLPGYP